MNVAQNVERSACLFPQSPAIIFEGRNLTYAELNILVNQLANSLTGLGITVGDRVALFLPNIPEFVIGYFAIQKLGAVLVSINAMLMTEEVRYILEDSNASIVFTTALLYPEVAPLQSQITTLRHVILCEGEGQGTLHLAKLLAGQSAHLLARELETSAPAAILYTSGTTGKQKGAVLTHGNVVSNYHATQHYIGHRPGDRHILFLPLFHCFGQNFIMNSATNSAGTLVLQRRFELESAVEQVQAQQVTHFYGVPAIYIKLIAAQLPRSVWSSVRYFLSASAALPVEVARHWQETYGMPIYEGYGLTETSPIATYNHEFRYKPGSIGTPIENVEMKIVDADGNTLAPGKWGEICIKGPNVMPGYFNRPAETTQAIKNGWFHTGDVGYCDDEGYYFIVDRIKDMINSAGFKVWPREVEEVLYQHPGIKECAVVGMPDPVNGEAAKARVVLHPGSNLTAEELAVFCRERLAAYKVPKSFEINQEIPRSPTGKVLKRLIRESDQTGQEEKA